MARVLVALVMAVALGATACSPSPSPSAPPPSAPLEAAVAANLRALVGEPTFLTAGSVADAAASADVRVAWPLIDLLRLHEGAPNGDRLVAALRTLTGFEPPPDALAWVAFSDHLLARDVPAPPGYRELKRPVYVSLDGDWAPWFDDAEADLDWREVTWGGVVLDGIESLDDPVVLAAHEATYLAPDDVVFGLVVAGEARAYPRRILDVHEAVNDVLGGVAVTLPYCTLCGAAIGYRAPTSPEHPRLTFGTSGLLQRSNKLMFDRESFSLWDQFRGVSVAGPRRGDTLEALDTTVATWSEWVAAHPETTVLALPRESPRYDGDFLSGRPADRPLFPVGAVDDRRPALDPVLGVIGPAGPVAFPVVEARAALDAGTTVRLGDVEVSVGAGGLRATTPDGPVVAHEASWFAWSQFHPTTMLWVP